MEIIHCFNFIMLFFCLAVSVATLVYSIQLSISLVRIFNWMKKRLAEIEGEEEEKEDEKPKQTDLNVGNYAIVQYDNEEE
jgi:hypothetical protein